MPVEGPLPLTCLYMTGLQHGTMDEYWKRIQFTAEDFRNLDIPALTTTGWFDAGQPGALFYWRNMRAYSPARDRPPAATKIRALYFHSGGHANTLDGDGRLSWEAAMREQPDHYTSPSLFARADSTHRSVLTDAAIRRLAGGEFRELRRILHRDFLELAGLLVAQRHDAGGLVDRDDVATGSHCEDLRRGRVLVAG
jgi:hypothetical protein